MEKVGSLLNKDVGQICRNNGWSVCFTRNDKRKGDRTLKYFSGGWRVPEHSKLAILRSVEKLLKSRNIEGKAFWYEAYCVYGYYDKLCIRIPL